LLAAETHVLRALGFRLHATTATPVALLARMVADTLRFLLVDPQQEQVTTMMMVEEWDALPADAKMEAGVVEPLGTALGATACAVLARGYARGVVVVIGEKGEEEEQARILAGAACWAAVVE